MTIFAEAVEAMRDLVSKGDVDLQAMRDTFMEEVGRYTTLTNDQLIEVLAASDDDYDPETWAEAIKLVEGGMDAENAIAQATGDDEVQDYEVQDAPIINPAVPVAPASTPASGTKETKPRELTAADRTKAARGKAIHLAALSAAHTLEGDKELTDTLNAVLEAPLTISQGPVKILLRLIELNSVKDAKGNVIECSIDGWPEIGSKFKEGSNALFDRYEYDEGNGKVAGSFLGDLFDTMPLGKVIADRIEACKKAKNKLPGAPSDLIAMGSAALEKEKKHWEQKRSNAIGARGALTRAIQLRHKMVALPEKLPNLACSFRFDATGAVLHRTQDVLSVYPKGGSPAGGVYFSVSEFLLLNFKAAVAKGGTIEALIESKGVKESPPKKRGTKDGTPTVEFPTINSFAQFDSGLSSFCHFLEGFLSDPTERKKMAAQFATRMAGAGGDDFLETFGKVMMTLETFFAPYRNRFVAMEEKKALGEEKTTKVA